MQKFELQIRDQDTNPYIIILKLPDERGKIFVAHPYIKTLQLGIIFALFSTMLFGRDTHKECFMLDCVNLKKTNARNISRIKNSKIQ